MASRPVGCSASGHKSALHVPLGVLTWVASIHGLLWWSNLLALTRPPRPQDIARTFPRGSPGRSRRQGNRRAEPRTLACPDVPVVPRRSVLCVKSMASSSWCPSESVPRLRSRAAPARVARSPTSPPSRWSAGLVRPERARTSSRLARTGGFVGLRWAGPGGTAKRPCPTEPADVATRSRESNVPTNTSTPR